MIDVSYIRQKEALGLGHAVLARQGTGGRRAVRGGAGRRRDRSRDALPAAVAGYLQLLLRAGAGRDGSAARADFGVRRGRCRAGSAQRDRSDRVYRIRDLVEKPKAADAPSNLADHRPLRPDAGDFRVAPVDRARQRRRNPVDRRLAT